MTDPGPGAAVAVRLSLHGPAAGRRATAPAQPRAPGDGSWPVNQELVTAGEVPIAASSARSRRRNAASASAAAEELRQQVAGRADRERVIVTHARSGMG